MNEASESRRATVDRQKWERARGVPRLSVPCWFQMYIEPSNAVVTWIPKNACSSLRHSVAVENGVIRREDQYGEIESMPYPFSPIYPQLAGASHSFVFLRCPYRRLISSFLDKVLKHELVAKEVSAHYCNGKPPGEISFHDFVAGIFRKRGAYLNIHWIPQTHFLIYERYDHYYSLENMKDAVEHLESWIDFQFIDVSTQKRHDLKRLERDQSPDNYLRSVAYLKEQKERYQRAPSYESMLNSEIIEWIDKAYEQDLDLYRGVCDESNLLVS